MSVNIYTTNIKIYIVKNMTETSKLYKGFQTVVPSKIRKSFNLDLDYILEWSINEKGNVEVEFRKKTGFMDLAGIFTTEQPTDAVELQRKMRRGEEIDIR
jgi:bifunctional DNA-binding transcriptional regulator/antitoxin component of YhaV-PrlF toxin-antitoxin module